MSNLRSDYSKGVIELAFWDDIWNEMINNKEKIIMGHYCRICGAIRPNEKFSGKGHKIHVCRKCELKPKEERENIEQEDEIFGFLKQSHISMKNVRRLKVLALSDNERIAELANIVLEVAEVRPYKKRRLKILAKERRDLFLKLRVTGLIFAHNY